jgi:hypothetical protein
MVIYSDDFCGAQSYFSYTVSDSVDCTDYILRQGCFSEKSCTGSIVITFQPNCSVGNYFDGSGCTVAAAGYYAPSGAVGVFYACDYSVLAGASNCQAPSESGCSAGQFDSGGSCFDVPYGYYNPTAGANILYYCATPDVSAGATSCPVASDDDGTATSDDDAVESDDIGVVESADDDLSGLCYSCDTCSSAATISVGVTALDTGAFSSCSKLISVDFSLSTVSSIPSNAFSDCSSLISVEFSDSIISIGSSAFASTALTTVEFPASLASIGDNAFDSCSYLQSVNFSSSIVSIGSYAFQYTALKSVVLPASLESMGISAFMYCTELESATVNAALPNIPENAFRSCSSLSTVDLGNVTTVDYAAFAYTALASVQFPDSLISIGSYAFTETNLVSVTFNEGLQGIGAYTFSSCGELTTASFSSTITYISSNAFESTNLASVVLPNSLTYLGPSSFAYCYSLESVVINEGLTSIPAYAFMNCPLSSAPLPSTITSVGDFAFYYHQLESVVLPSALASIGQFAYFSAANTLEVVEFNDGLVTIANGAFYSCPIVGNLSLPSTVTTVGPNAFSGNRFSSVTIPSSVISIGSTAFGYSTELTTVTLGTGITYVPDYAFLLCSLLSSVTLLGDVTTIGSYAFEGSNLASFTAPESLLYINTGAFLSSPSLAAVTLNEGLLYIYDDAFCLCPSLLSVVVPSTVVYLSESAFCSPTVYTTETVDDTSVVSPTPSPTTFGVYGFDYGREVNLTAATFTCMKSEGMEFFIARGFFTTPSNKSFVDPYLCSHLRLARAAGITTKGIFVYPKPVSGLSPWWPLKSLKSELQTRCPKFADLRIWLTVRQDDDHHNWMHVKRNKAWFRDFVTSCKSNFNHCGIHTSQSSWESVFGSSSYFPDNIVGMPLWYQNVDSLANFQDYENSDNVLGGWSQPKVKQYDSMVTMCDATVGLDWLYQL